MSTLSTVRDCELRVDILQRTYATMCRSYSSNGGSDYGEHGAITQESMRLVEMQLNEAQLNLTDQTMQRLSITHNE